MNDYVLLSVIVPVYNTEQYIDCCMKSLIEQDMDEMEIIIVDDGSPDNAGDVCNLYADIYSFIKVIHKENEGLGLARNAGMKIARGKYISFLDSDDFVQPGYYNKLLQHAETGDYDICFAGGYHNVKNGKVKNSVIFSKKCWSLMSNHDIRQNAARIISDKPGTHDNLPGSACLALYKTAFLREKGLCFESERVIISEDVWFNIDALCSAEHIFYTDVIGYMYRYNDASLSRGYRAERFYQLIHFTNALKEKCANNNLEDYYGRIAIFFWVMFEKCINQEVCFMNRSDCLVKIKEMCMNDTCHDVMVYLKRERGLVGFHGLLLQLLFYKRYVTVFSLLKIYNLVYHR